MKSQTQEILDYLKAGNSITPQCAIKRFRCFRLGARIYDLRAAGYRIETETITRRSKRTARIVRYAAYRLVA